MRCVPGTILGHRLGSTRLSAESRAVNLVPPSHAHSANEVAPSLDVDRDRARSPRVDPGERRSPTYQNSKQPPFSTLKRVSPSNASSVLASVKPSAMSTQV